MEVLVYPDGAVIYKEKDKIILAVKDIPFYDNNSENPNEIIGYTTIEINPYDYIKI
ncbi:MAG: hypothetical protein Q4D13_01100 [Erysipelotrichaceae bacterium]|nr:hypothetical protein [Erysipelotrichaceae bacterium]